jgi:hypothetical protein
MSRKVAQLVISQSFSRSFNIVANTKKTIISILIKVLRDVICKTIEGESRDKLKFIIDWITASSSTDADK